MSTYYPVRHTAEEYRTMASDSHRESVDSFDRSDTDGALSQWANDSMAQCYRKLAALAENDGLAQFTVLADLEGIPVHAKPIETKYGTAWGVLDPQNRIIEFVAWHPARPTTLSKKGYTEIEMMLPAVVEAYSTGGYSVNYWYEAKKWIGWE